MVTPKYILDYADAVHLTNYSSRRLGEYYGKVMKKVLIDKQTWQPLSPKKLTISDSIIIAEFNVPVEPLVIDYTAVGGAKTNLGFEYFDNNFNNIDSASIKAVSILNSNTIKITLSKVPTGSNKRLRYGAPSGNIRDSDATPAIYNDYWVPSVYSRVKTLDVIFTSETYGDEFASYLGIQHVLVDIERKTYPVSGTMVRDNPFKLWELIPIEVKSYYTKRIVIMGPESTGKTMLTKRLADEYGVSYVPEYGREYTDTKPGKTLDINDFYTIAHHHNDDIIEAQLLGDKYLIIDTEAVTTKLFGQLYIDGYIDTRLDDIIKYQYFDLILLMDIDVPWVDDGSRDFPNDRQRHFNMIKNELDRLGRKYVIISGTYDERFDKAKKEVDKLGYL